jgi:tetratricopeptide (TPR) repeat protein
VPPINYIGVLYTSHYVNYKSQCTVQDELEQAVYCYSRAIKQSPATLSYHWSRVELLERLGNQARALRSYTYMLKFLKPDQAKVGATLAS